MTTLLVWILHLLCLLEDKHTSHFSWRMEKEGVACCTLIISFKLIKPEGFRNVIIKPNRMRFTAIDNQWNTWEELKVVIASCNVFWCVDSVFTGITSNLQLWQGSSAVSVYRGIQPWPNFAHLQKNSNE